jgi:hypothetical protein
MDRRLLSDNGGRRSRIDRRRFSYTVHIPERRHGKDRRLHHDRRDKPMEHIAPIKDKDVGQESAVF